MEMNTICSKYPPSQPKPGDLWFNVAMGLFYCLDDNEKWVLSDEIDVDVASIKMDNICGKHPPSQPKPGDLWFNTTTGYFYCLDANDVWVSSDNYDVDVDSIAHYDTYTTHNDAYSRAMTIL